MKGSTSAPNSKETRIETLALVNAQDFGKRYF